LESGIVPKGNAAELRSVPGKGILMLDGNDLPAPARRDRSHDRWLAMQSAYADYRRASEALESTHHPTEESSFGECVRLTILEAHQRVAFERYLEARMEYLEFRVDERTLVDETLAPMPDQEETRFGSWVAWARRKPVLPILTALLLCSTAFSLMREQKHVRDLEASRDELRAALNQTRDGLQVLAQKLEASRPLQEAAVQPVEHIARPPVAKASTQARKHPAPAQKGQLTRRISQKQVATNRSTGPRTSDRRHARKAG
jgi:hypothetical protein